MSLSNTNSDSGAWGTVFSLGREQSISSMDRGRTTAWTPADEAAYLRRVKEKAEQMAASILAEARAEADKVRESARQEGFDAGMGEAQAELDNFRNAMTESVASVLNSIEGQCSHIFDQWREDLVGVARLAVEKITAVQLAAERGAVLESLLTEAVGVLEKRREVVIRVHPDDEPVITDMLSMTQARFPDVRSWRVRGDAQLSPGGMVVESESSLAEGRLESRQAAVDEILSQLSLTDIFSNPAHDDDMENLLSNALAAGTTEGHES